jgi:hypothetical protein
LVDGPSSEEAWLMAFNIFLYQYDLYPPLSKQYAGCFMFYKCLISPSRT